MSYKYYSIEDNRAQLKKDCQLIRDNIDDYKGKLSYVNYDIGTGKSRSFAEIIPELIRNNQRVLVLCYSYKVVHEWYQNIMDFARQKEEIKQKTYIVASPAKFDMVETIKCTMQNDFKDVSISVFTNTVCKRCVFQKEHCVVDWKSKLEGSDFRLVLTSNSLHFCHSEYFKAFDVVVFDETSNIVSNLNIKFSVIDEIHADLHYSCVSHLGSVRALCSQIDEHVWRPMCACRKDLENIGKNVQIDKGLIDVTLLDKAIKDIDAFQRKWERRFKVPFVYIWKIKRRLQKLRIFYRKTRDWFVLPVQEKRVVTCTDPKHYTKIENRINDVKLTARTFITLYNLEPSSLRKTAYFVLSALNTKDYVENLFQHHIDERCHFGKDPEGNIRLNSYPNVISTVYSRQSPRRNAKYSKGYSESRSVNYTDRRAIAERIVAFVRSFPEDRIAIGGIKSVYAKLTDQSFRYPNYSHQGINSVLGTLTASNKKGRELVAYDDYRLRKDNDIDHLIPYIHFGISGTNDLKPFRALLIINVYHTNPFIQQLYCGANNDPFNLTSDSFNYNVNIVPARQLEGRLLRFQNTVQFKYIYRLNHYDRILDSHNGGNNGFPQTSHVFNFHTHGELDCYMEGIKDYKSMSFCMRGCLNENYYKEFFDARDPGKTMFKDRRKWTFLMSKYLEHLYRNLETAPGESPVIEEIDDVFISQHHRSREKRRRDEHFKQLEMIREYFKLQRLE